MARTFTPADLLAYDGSDTSKPVYIAVKGIVYDVSASREFYGKGGPYEVFAGRECSRALAIMKVDAAECNGDLADCTEKQLKTLNDWIAKFAVKYSVVGQLAPGRSSPEQEEADVDPQSLLRKSPFPPSMVATLLLVAVLTVLGAYVLFLDMRPPLSPEMHSEL